MLCGILFRLDTVWKPHSLYSAPYCVRGCEGRCGSYKGLGSDAHFGGVREGDRKTAAGTDDGVKKDHQRRLFEVV